MLLMSTKLKLCGLGPSLGSEGKVGGLEAVWCRGGSGGSDGSGGNNWRDEVVRQRRRVRYGRIEGWELPHNLLYVTLKYIFLMYVKIFT